MMASSPAIAEASEILYLALAEPIGLLLQVGAGEGASEVERNRAALYQARQASGDRELDGLQIRISPFPEGQLVVVKRRPEVKAEVLQRLGETR